MELVTEIEKISKRKGCKPSQVAIAWVIAQSKREGMPLMIPIPGAAAVSRVKENTVRVELTADEVKEVDDLVKRVPVYGERYGGPVAKLSFGDSPAMKN